MCALAFLVNLFVSRVPFGPATRRPRFLYVMLVVVPYIRKNKHCCEIFLRSCLVALCESQLQFQLPIKYNYRQGL